MDRMTGPLSLVSLATDDLSVVVCPQLGARILELTHRPTRRQWMWRNWGMPLVRQAAGAAYDDVWVGGFEELFPNDAPTRLGEADLPDHGELWSLDWEVADLTSSSLSLEGMTPVTGHSVAKTIRAEGNQLHIGYSIRSAAATVVPYLFKLHPAISVTEWCTIELPGGVVEKVDPSFGTIVGSPEELSWPGAPPMALDRCRRSSSGAHEFVYVRDLPEGWCGVTDHAAAASIRFRYDLQLFPYCWLFMTYGGWRGHNVVVVEPCTTYPKDLHRAAAGGTTPSLEPGQTATYEVDIELQGS